MSEAVGRGFLAIVVALGLGSALILLPLPRRVPRDLVLAGYATVVAVLGVFAVVGGQAALLAAAVIGAAVVLGAVVYGLVALAGHWAERD